MLKVSLPSIKENASMEELSEMVTDMMQREEAIDLRQEKPPHPCAKQTDKERIPA